MTPAAAQNAPAEHRSRNALFWRADAGIDEARRHHGWVQFHRQCGQAGLYFDNIERDGRAYSCDSFRLERRAADYLRYLVSEGSGRTVLDAVLSCFDAAVAAGWPVTPDVRDLLTAPPPRARRPVVSDDDILGGPVVVDDSELV